MSEAHTPIGRDALLRAISKSDGIVDFGRRLNVRYQNVQTWLQDGRKFATPSNYCKAIELEFGEPRHELRPDLFDESDRIATNREVA